MASQPEVSRQLELYQALHDVKTAAPQQWTKMLVQLARLQDAWVFDTVRAPSETVLRFQGKAMAIVELVDMLAECSNKLQSLPKPPGAKT